MDDKKKRNFVMYDVVNKHSHDDMTMENNERIIITFDVGGQIYRVSKHLLFQFPNSILFMKASDIKVSNSDENAIYIDRHGYSFKYVIDYMMLDYNNLFNLPITAKREVIFKDMDFYGFNINFPKEVMDIVGIKYHHIKWDASYACAGIQFKDYNNAVENYDDSDDWQSVLGSVGFQTGIHYWSIKIIEDMEKGTMIGISDHFLLSKKMKLRNITDPNGGTFYSANGELLNGKHPAVQYGPSYSNGDVIGTLLNMNRKTVTFYKNGIRVALAADSESLTCKEYYPCIALDKNGQKIHSVSRNIFSRINDTTYQPQQQPMSQIKPKLSNKKQQNLDENDDDFQNLHHDLHFPKEVRYLDGVEYHQVVWDVSYACAGIQFKDNSNAVQNYVDSDDWQSVLGSVGFQTGIHYWSIEILGKMDHVIMIGISYPFLLSKKLMDDDPDGGTFYDADGELQMGDLYNIEYGPSYSNGDVIGTLLNMNRKTVTFYKNGKRVALAADSGSLTCKEYYPCIAFGRNGQKIHSISRYIYEKSKYEWTY